MSEISHNQNPQVETIIEKWQATTASVVSSVAGIIHQHLQARSAFDKKEIAGVEPNSILPFTSPILPANEAVLSRQFPGYSKPSAELLKELGEYASAKENYGTAPGEASAIIVQLVKAIEPETAFVFGTARGRLEQLIAQSCTNTEIATIDIPTELVEVAAGKPDSNNIRYRKNIGIEDDAAIGDIFRSDKLIADRVHQILGDSFTFLPQELAGTMRFVVVDGNHVFPNSLMDLANALELAHEDGAVIVVDDFKKKSPLNMGVDAAVNTFSQITNLRPLWPCPRPGEEGLEAAVAIIVVPADLKDKPALVKALRAMASTLKGFENE